MEFIYLVDLARGIRAEKRFGFGERRLAGQPPEAENQMHTIKALMVATLAREP